MTLPLVALFALASAPIPALANDDAYVQSRRAELYDLELQLGEETPALSASLKAARLDRLHALRAYADAGVFPHNHESTTPVPLFIDSHDTPCAVAFMILTSGDNGEQLGRAIAADNNRVLLPHDDGRIASWAAANGFTLAELERIQEPDYDYRPDESAAEMRQQAKLTEAKRIAANKQALELKKRSVDVKAYRMAKAKANNARL